MISPYTFQPRGRLLNVMRQVGDPGLINLAAGLPSVHCVPKEDLAKAFAVTLKENADESLGYHVPDGDVRLRELLVDRFHRRGVNTKVDQIVITTGCSQALHGMIRLLTNPGDIVACEAPAYYATLEIVGDRGLTVLPIPVREVAESISSSPRSCSADFVQSFLWFARRYRIRPGQLSRTRSEKG